MIDRDRIVAANEDAIGFRALTREDLPTLRRWLNTPHVYEWWGVHSGPGSIGGAGPDAATVEQMEEKYGDAVDLGSTTLRYVITLDGRAVGLIQWYDLAHEPEYAAAIGEGTDGVAGIDLLVGELDATGRGLGAVVIDEFVRGIVFASPAITRVVGAPHPDNARSLRAFEKAGFTFVRDALVPDSGPERVLVRVRPPAPPRSRAE